MKQKTNPQDKLAWLYAVMMFVIMYVKMFDDDVSI